MMAVGFTPLLPLYPVCQRCWCPQEPPSRWKTCAACRAHVAACMRRLHSLRAPASPGALLACCGGWHLINRVPFTTPCCGTIYLSETLL